MKLLSAFLFSLGLSVSVWADDAQDFMDNITGLTSVDCRTYMRIRVDQPEFSKELTQATMEAFINGFNAGIFFSWTRMKSDGAMSEDQPLPFSNYKLIEQPDETVLTNYIDQACPSDLDQFLPVIMLDLIRELIRTDLATTE